MPSNAGTASPPMPRQINLQFGMGLAVGCRLDEGHARLPGLS
jgi:hypothetical protein